MNKKGLTLVELLAVITIIGLILLIVIPNITNMSKKASKQYCEKTLLVLEKAAKTYVDQTSFAGLSNIGDKVQITIQQLADSKLISLPIVIPYTKEQMLPTYIIVVTKIDTNEYEYQLPNKIQCQS